MRPIDAHGSYTINASDNTGYSLGFGGGIISVADKWGHIVSEFDADDAPTIDPESLRPQGEWEAYPSDQYRRCSYCKTEWEKEKIPRIANYCPYCGARLKGAGD